MENFPGTPRQITELGAGDGHFLLRVAQKLSPSLAGRHERHAARPPENMPPQTLAAFTSLGWRAEIVIADVFDWPPAPAQIVIANLFLHHFEEEQLAELLRVISQRAKLFVAIEPHRFRCAFPCGQLLWLIGCNDVTRHDAAVSIRAGFLGGELSALWPDKQNWQLTERRAGLFSHLFIAQANSIEMPATKTHSRLSAAVWPGLTLGIGLRQRGVPVTIAGSRALSAPSRLRRIHQRSWTGNSRCAWLEGKISGRERNRSALLNFLFWKFKIAGSPIAVARALPFAFRHGQTARGRISKTRRRIADWRALAK